MFIYLLRHADGEIVGVFTEAGHAVHTVLTSYSAEHFRRERDTASELVIYDHQDNLVAHYFVERHFLLNESTHL